LDDNLTMTGAKTLANGNFKFNGMGAQTTGILMPATVKSLTIANASGVTLMQSTIVNGALSMLDGNFILGNNNLVITSTGSIVGGSNTSFINENGTGILTQATAANIAYTFPIGVVTYAPVTITPDATDNFSVQFFQSANATPNQTTLTTPLTSIAHDSYFEITHTGSATATLTLPYGPSASQLTNTSDLVMAHYNTATSSWENLGGAYAASSVTVTGVSSFSPFTLGSIGVPPIALGVMLKNFAGIQQKNKNQITWETAEETTLKNFELQRSSNGFQFSTLAEVAAKGAANNYQYSDETFGAGTSYYRLKMIKTNNEVSFSKTVAVRAAANAEVQITASPLPVSTMLEVHIAATDPSGDLTLINSVGSIVLTQKVQTGSALVNMSQLPTGLYLLRYTGISTKGVLKITKL